MPRLVDIRSAGRPSAAVCAVITRQGIDGVTLHAAAAQAGISADGPALLRVS